MNLGRPTVLHELLKNITVILPEGYELIVGLRPNNVYLYYEVIQATMLADVHSFKLVLHVPLKSVDRQYELYKMVVLPTRILDNAYAQFEIGKDYFGINLLQRSYLTLSEMDVLKCRGEDIKICPANQAVYSTEVNSCALSLFLQSTQTRELCKRTVVTRPASPKLERYGSMVLYYLVEPQRLHLQCQYNRSWQTYTMTLQGGGVLKNAGSCHLTLQGLQLYPTLSGETEFEAQVPELYIPTIPEVTSAQEMEVLRQMSFLNETTLKQLTSSISSHHIEADISTLFHLHTSSLQRTSKSNWIVVGLIMASAVLILFISYYFTRSYIRNIVKVCIGNRDNTTGVDVQKPEDENPPMPASTSANCEIQIDATPETRYAVHSLQNLSSM